MLSRFASVALVVSVAAWCSPAGAQPPLVAPANAQVMQDTAARFNAANSAQAQQVAALRAFAARQKMKRELKKQAAAMRAAREAAKTDALGKAKTTRPLASTDMPLSPGTLSPGTLSPATPPPGASSRGPSSPATPSPAPRARTEYVPIGDLK
jgi:hypothetical protein